MKMTSPSFMANTSVSGGSLPRQTEYIVCREGKYFVSQCLNFDVSSFGETIDEAVANLKEAVELYFEDDPQQGQYEQTGKMLMGKTSLMPGLHSFKDIIRVLLKNDYRLVSQ